MSLLENGLYVVHKMSGLVAEEFRGPEHMPFATDRKEKDTVFTIIH
jgi:hypothetical protein